MSSSEHPGPTRTERSARPLPAGAPVTLRPMTPSDVPATAALHLAELPRGFLTRLGPGFLRALHGAQLPSPYGVALVAVDPEEPERLLGFLLGSTLSARHSAYVLRHHRAELALAGVHGLARHPELLRAFARRRAGHYLRRVTTPVPVPPGGREEGETAVLSQLVVCPAARGRGAGRALTEGFLARARAAGAGRAALVTRADAGGSGAYWARLGWVMTGLHHNLDGEPIAAFARRL